MAERNLFKGTKPDTRVGRSSFDLSKRVAQHWSVGALHPIWCMETVPNDYLEIDVNHIIRSFPMATASFSRVRAHFDFYFVPYTQIWKQFLPFYTTREDVQSSSLQGHNFVPTFNLSGIKRRALADCIVNGFNGITSDTSTYMGYDIHGYRVAGNALRLMDYLGYGSVPGYEQLAVTADAGNPVNPSNYLSFIKDYRVNPFRIAAYQKIWSCFYRDSVHDTARYTSLFNFDDIPCNSEATSHIDSYRTAQDLNRMFTLRYRCYKRDMFTGQYPSPQFGAVSSISVSSSFSGTASLNGETGYANFISDGYPNGMPDGVNIVSHGPSTGQSNAGGLSVGTANNKINHNHTVSGTATINGSSATAVIGSIYDIYKAQALQTWRERLMRAGNRYKDGFRAIFGSVPQFMEDDYPVMIDSFSQLIEVDDITQTSGDVDGNGLGNLGGLGINVNQSRKIKFSTKDFGVVMCIFSLLPEMDYNSTGIDRTVFNYKQEDFYLPMYENLGLVPATLKEYDAGSYFGRHYSNDFGPNSVSGYLPRYYEYKTSVDTVHGLFQMISHRGTTPVNTSSYIGPLSKFVTPRVDSPQVLSGSSFDVSFFYVNPSVLDSMFEVRSNGQITTDRFFGAIRFNVRARRPMSVLGVHQV